MRLLCEAPSCMLVAELLAAGAHVRAYDPIAMHNAHRLLAARPHPADNDRLTLGRRGHAGAGNLMEGVQQPGFRGHGAAAARGRGVR